MDIIRNFYSHMGSSSIPGALWGSFKMTLLMLIAMIAIGMVASGVEKAINSAIAVPFGAGFAFLFCNYLTFPGTILHELSHAFVATVTGAKVTEISFFDFGGMSLGHVNYIPRGTKFMRGLQNSLTACAPVISGCIALVFLFNWLSSFEQSTPAYIGIIYLIVCVIDHMTMSLVDAVNYFRGIKSTAIFFFVLNAVLFMVLV